MNSLLHLVSLFKNVLQDQLFPVMHEALGPLSERQEQFVRALALLGLDRFVAVRHGRGRRGYDRAGIARAFLAKAVYNLPTTRALLDRLECDVVLRRLCGWESAAQVPDETIFSRAFADFARREFAQKVHAALIQSTQSERLVGHILRDSTAIEAREKPAPKPQPSEPAPRRLHRKSGTATRPEQMTRLDRQCSGSMTLEEMLAELPQDCARLQGRQPRKEVFLGRLQTPSGRGRWPDPDQLRIDLGLAERYAGSCPVSSDERAAGDQPL